MLFVLTFFACSSPAPQSVPIVEEPPIPSASATFNPPPEWFPHTVAESVTLRDSLAVQLDDIVAKVAQNDTALATDLRTKVIEFRKLTPSMIVDETTDHNPVFAKDGCPHEPCDRFVSEDMSVVALWNMDSKVVAVNYHTINSVIVPYFIFHEMYHRSNPGSRTPGNADYAVGAPNPWEMEAWNYQSSVVNAASAGEYHTLVHTWAEGVANGVIPSIMVLNTANAPVPNNFAKFLNQGVGNSDFALQGVGFLLEWDLNRELIAMSHGTEAEKAQALLLLHNALRAAPSASPEASILVRESMRSWRRTQ